ncbi:glycosyltransferase family 61 protein [Chryseolinea sp. H1M3-3]|uniref:glycosyltransferase family 61 protein n=1 Tax=Chryseolinea sp. H1M3-3 TaxID=3034144 RepID=UPI0023ED7883|nr:glycosyltransferase family 61 protein [Chryseolinea sp. H1M3-3]
MEIRTLPAKVYRKGLRLLSKFVPRNIKYRPVGITNVSKEKKYDSIEYIEIAPPYTLTLDLEKRFIEDCSPYAKPIMSVQFPGDFIVGIKDGRLYSYDAANMAVISRENLLVEQVSFQWSNDNVLSGKHNILFREKQFIAPKKYKGKVFSMLAGGGAITYYYHWVFDAIPKIFLLKQSGLFDEIDYFLVPNYIYPYQKEYLTHFGISPDKIINGEAVKHLEADELFVASYVRIDDHHPKWICDFLYNSFVRPKKNIVRDKRIYIARGDAAVNRKVINESELIEMLKEYDFEIHYLSGLSVVEQADIFNSASLVVGAHGAGLSNLVFCEPGTKVLEFFPDRYVRHLFYDLANKRGAEYHYLLCASEGTANNSSDGQKLSLIADVKAIQRKIETLISKT